MATLTDVRPALERFSAGQSQFPAFNPRLEFKNGVATLPDAGAFVRRLYVGAGAGQRLLAHHENPEPYREWKRADGEFRAECEHLRPLLLQAGVKLPPGVDAASQILAWAIGDARTATPLNAFGSVARELQCLATREPSDSEGRAKYTPDDEELALTPKQLYDHFKLTIEYATFLRRLDRWRPKHKTGWITVDSGRKNTAKYRYFLADVEAAAEELLS